MDRIIRRDFRGVVAICVSLIRSASIALLHRRRLPPLALYWDSLAKVNWWILFADEEQIFDLDLRDSEWEKYSRLCEIGELSDSHGRLLSAFIRHGWFGTPKPNRPPSVEL